MKVQTYNIVDMTKVMLRVNELTRENKNLKKQLAESATTIAELEHENAQQLQQLIDFQGHYARQRTAPVTLAIQRG
jgi:septal ring factor EnvC (AmiA/AmiB activator)